MRRYLFRMTFLLMLPVLAVACQGDSKKSRSKVPAGAAAGEGDSVSGGSGLPPGGQGGSAGNQNQSTEAIFSLWNGRADQYHDPGAPAPIN